MQHRDHPGIARFQIEELRSARPSLRIAVVTETYPPEINGVAVTLAKVVEGLRERNHSLQLIRPLQPVFDKQRSSDADEILTAGLPIPRYPGLRMGMPSKKLLVRHWSLQRPDIVHIATEGPLGWSALHAARALKLPVSTDFRTNFHAYSGHYGAGWLSRAILRYLRKFHNSASCTTVPTQALSAELQSWGFERLSVVARGVDTERFRVLSPAERASAREHFGVSPTAELIVGVSRLVPRKGFDIAISAVARLARDRPQLEMLIAGAGRDAKRLNELAKKQGAPVRFLGRTPFEDLPLLYGCADIFTMLCRNRWGGLEQEGFGIVFLEAAACGVPQVAGSSGGAAEAVDDGVSGIVVKDPTSIDEVTQDFSLLLNSPDLRHKMGSAGRVRAVESFSYDVLTARLWNTLSQL